jgi:2-polyprenyl-6-hydroxyphenyl methylase / 3-demethylubiquinone-9 3-methyltransferase
MERKNRNKKLINNQFYDDLHDNWYLSNNHPVALLRAENNLRNPWIKNEIKKHFPHKCKILDIGCGAGILTNFLALDEHDITGIDISEKSLTIAEKFDTTKKVKYLKANAYNIPLENHTFDVICAMDVLEHIENPAKLIQEASRLLKHGGLFFFHTFTKNILSYLLVIKCVEWFIPNTPKNMHVYNLFIKPKELKKMCYNSGLTILSLKGFQPKISSLKLLKMVLKKELKDDFPFIFKKKIKTGYCGFAMK